MQFASVVTIYAFCLRNTTQKLSSWWPTIHKVCLCIHAVLPHNLRMYTPWLGQYHSYHYHRLSCIVNDHVIVWHGIRYSNHQTSLASLWIPPKYACYPRSSHPTRFIVSDRHNVLPITLTLIMDAKLLPFAIFNVFTILLSLFESLR